ncbi:hypothetical protein ABW21_db0206627 [Orbilia brochopaga]|nr:hypothetical protein ABW21_db0206627 [Drechslerella brochopaga]
MRAWSLPPFSRNARLSKRIAEFTESVNCAHLHRILATWEPERADELAIIIPGAPGEPDTRVDRPDLRGIDSDPRERQRYMQFRNRFFGCQGCNCDHAGNLIVGGYGCSTFFALEMCRKWFGCYCHREPVVDEIQDWFTDVGIAAARVADVERTFANIPGMGFNRAGPKLRKVKQGHSRLPEFKMANNRHIVGGTAEPYAVEGRSRSPEGTWDWFTGLGFLNGALTSSLKGGFRKRGVQTNADASSEKTSTEEKTDK